MTKKDQMLLIIEEFTSHSNELPAELQTKLTKIKSEIEGMSEEQFENKSDRVFSTPAQEHDSHSSPQNEMLLLYDQLEKASRHSENEQMMEAIQNLRYYLDIQEKDGYFPS